MTGAQTQTQYRSDRGEPVTLEARPLGVGGEGKVYAVVGQPGRAAKLYHRPPDAARTRKLGAMTRLSTPALQAVCAWPDALLYGHAAPDTMPNTVLGLLMPRLDLSRARPIHDLTGPASRLKHFPQADFRFLVRAARNLAAAVSTIHAHGQVIGDLNPNNVYVNAQATVTFIDADSFQVTAGGERFLCPVGVTEFTPPELQGADLSKVVRTPDHDAFGLATFIFQLLFLGHYPWAGVYAGGQAPDMAGAIRAHHFAWGRGAAALGLRPPPATPPLSSLPTELGELFEAAFDGPQRPDAAEWVEALQDLQARLVTCALNPAHQHDPAIHCPWCALEAGSKASFFGRPAPAPTAVTGDDLEALWQAVLAVPPPPRVALALPPSGLPLTPHVRLVRRLASAVLVLGLILCFWALYHGLLEWAAAGLAVALVAFARSVTYRGRRRTLLRLRALRRGALGTQQDFINQGAGGAFYQATLQELTRVRDELAALPVQAQVREAAALDAHRQRLTAQLLAAQPLRPDLLPGLNERRVRALAALGVTSAAGLTRERLAATAGLSGRLSRSLLAWRAELISQSGVQAAPLPESQHLDLQRQQEAERRRLLERLRQGPAALRQTHLQATAEHARVQRALDEEARKREALTGQL